MYIQYIHVHVHTTYIHMYLPKSVVQTMCPAYSLLDGGTVRERDSERERERERGGGGRKGGGREGDWLCLAILTYVSRKAPEKHNVGQYRDRQRQQHTMKLRHTGP